MDDLLKKVEIEQQQIQPLIEYMKLHIQLLANILNLWPEFYIDYIKGAKDFYQV